MVEKAFKALEVRTMVISSIIVFAVAEMAVIYYGYRPYFTPYMLLIPIFFLLMGVCLLLLLSRIKRKLLHPARAIARLMLFNVAEFLLSIGILFVYVYTIDEQRGAFMLAFGLFYIMFMCLKLFVLYNIDHQYKIEREERIENEKIK